MGLSIRGYGIHGTNVPSSIGKAASHGCIRMAKADLEELYPMVQVGDTVELIGQRNDETAELFGDGKNPAASQPATQVAAASAAPAMGVQQAAAPAAEQAANAPGKSSRLTSTGLTGTASLTVAGSI
jgi:hypothetical protein